jgi:hypothetical protein
MKVNNSSIPAIPSKRISSPTPDPTSIAKPQSGDQISLSNEYKTAPKEKAPSEIRTQAEAEQFLQDLLNSPDDIQPEQPQVEPPKTEAPKTEATNPEEPKVVQPKAEPPKMDANIPAFATVDEAEQWAKANYPSIEWDFKGASPETINPTLAQFDKLAKKWPEALNRIKYIGTFADDAKKLEGFKKAVSADQLKKLDTTIEAYAAKEGTFEVEGYMNTTSGEYGDVIGLNPAYFANPEKYKSDLKFGTFAVNSMEGLLTHEIGHVMEYKAKMDGWEKTIFDVSDPSLPNIAYLNFLWMSQNQPTSELSSYSTESSHEAFAEGFAAMNHGNKATDFTTKEEAYFQTLHDTPWRSVEDVKKLSDLSPAEREAALKKINEVCQKMGIDIKDFKPFGS